MGCVCCSLTSFASIVLDALERISLCTVCALLTCCLLFTIITVLVMGVGIGYHYCFVSNAVDSMGNAAKQAGAFRSGPERTMGSDGIMRSVDNGAAKRSFMHKIARRDNANNTALANKVAQGIANKFANGIRFLGSKPELRSTNDMDIAKKTFLAHHMARRDVNRTSDTNFKSPVSENRNLTAVRNITNYLW